MRLQHVPRELAVIQRSNPLFPIDSLCSSMKTRFDSTNSFNFTSGSTILDLTPGLLGRIIIHILFENNRLLIFIRIVIDFHLNRRVFIPQYHGRF